MSVPIKAVATLTLFTIGAIAGYRIHQEEMAEQTTVKPKSDDLGLKIRKSGLEIITSDGMPDDTMSLATYMKHLYRGLYMIGRTRAVLKGTIQESIARKLLHLHHQRRPSRDEKLVEWYTTVGQTSTDDLADLLKKCPEANSFDVRYIAYAMGENVPGLTFPKLDDEIVEWFAA